MEISPICFESPSSSARPTHYKSVENIALWDCLQWLLLKRFVIRWIRTFHLPPLLFLQRMSLKYVVSIVCLCVYVGEYSCLKVDLAFQRKFSYYLLTIYIPCDMLVVVSWVSFWLDANAIPARVSLGVTTLLTMATQTTGINNSLPPVSYTKVSMERSVLLQYFNHAVSYQTLWAQEGGKGGREKRKRDLGCALFVGYSGIVIHSAILVTSSLRQRIAFSIYVTAEDGNAAKAVLKRNEPH